MYSVRICLAACLVFTLCLRAYGDDVESLMKRLPASANVVAVVQVERILRSDRAQKEQWAQNQQTDFLAGASTLPPWVRTFARASHVHPGESQHGWSVAVATTTDTIDIQATALREGGTVQTISGYPAVRSQRNAYFIRVEPKLIGIVSPAFRQDAYRWLKVAESRPITQSHWLGRVISEEDADIAIAFDGREMFDPVLLRRRLSEFLSNHRRERELKEMHTLLMSLEGLCFTANVGEKTKAGIRMDFSSEVPAKFRSLLKALLLEYLDDSGATLEDFADSRVEASDYSVRLTTDLSDEGLRRVMSLVATPHPLQFGAGTTTPRMEVSVGRTREYLRQVDQVLTDLRKANRRATNYLKTATWHEKFANKIENLPMMNVDPELLNYSATLASRFRALAASLRGVPVQVDLLERSITWNVYRDPGWGQLVWYGGNAWGWVGRSPSWNTTSNVDLIRSRQAKIIAENAGKREEIWQMIDDDRSRIRRAMTEKHGRQF